MSKTNVMKCKHCNKGFSCGCQKTKAADGSIVHKTCVRQYNASKGIMHVTNDTLTNSINKSNLNLSNRR